MHPAYSVIFFTTSSGAGYGLLFWLSIAEIFGFLPESRWLVFVALIFALALVTLGLLSSTLHLGHPERAFRAFSQWRSSWLSREGVLAVLTYMPSGVWCLIEWMDAGERGWIVILATLSALGAAVTVYSTGMIYASLRTIRQWYRTDVPYLYILLGGSTGVLLLGFLVGAFTSGGGAWLYWLCITLLVISASAKWIYWQNIDADEGQYTAAMALGLAEGSTVRTLDPPHTTPNFVMREMGYSVARKHATKLRFLSVFTLFFVPVLAVVGAWLSSWEVVFFALAILSAAVGVFTERWLFFAEAEHVSMLYYGKNRA